MPIARLSFKKIVSILYSHPLPTSLSLDSHEGIINHTPPPKQTNKNVANVLQINEYFHQKTYPRPFMAALFMLFPNWNNLNVINSRLYKLWYSHKMECCLVIRKDYITDICNDVGDSHRKLNKRRQTWKLFNSPYTKFKYRLAGW